MLGLKTTIQIQICIIRDAILLLDREVKEKSLVRRCPVISTQANVLLIGTEPFIVITIVFTSGLKKIVSWRNLQEETFQNLLSSLHFLCCAFLEVKAEEVVGSHRNVYDIEWALATGLRRWE